MAPVEARRDSVRFGTPGHGRLLWKDLQFRVGERLASALLPDMLEKRGGVELADMNRIGCEDLEEEFVGLLAVQPGSEQALLDEQSEKLAAKHHGGDVGAGAAMFRQQPSSDSDGLGTKRGARFALARGMAGLYGLHEFPHALQVLGVDRRRGGAAAQIPVE